MDGRLQAFSFLASNLDAGQRLYSCAGRHDALNRPREHSLALPILSGGAKMDRETRAIVVKSRNALSGIGRGFEGQYKKCKKASES